MTSRSIVALTGGALLLLVGLAGIYVYRQSLSDRREIAITVNGFSPATLTLAPKIPVELVFVRQTDATCAREVVIADLHVQKELPLGIPVVVQFTPTARGTITFACGMDMFEGKLVVK